MFIQVVVQTHRSYALLVGDLFLTYSQDKTLTQEIEQFIRTYKKHERCYCHQIFIK